jgi:hypothetical protein
MTERLHDFSDLVAAFADWRDELADRVRDLEENDGRNEDYERLAIDVAIFGKLVSAFSRLVPGTLLGLDRGESPNWLEAA